jgi:alpha-beta hydrolase superfamily lysophospholipase
MLRILGFLVIVVVLLAVFANYLRRTSMFFPSKFPEGNWGTTAADVHFASKDGTKLHGWLFRAQKPDAPLLIFFHGNTGNITDRASIAANLAERGVSVFVFDWRGYGKSEGSPREERLYEDAIAAYDYAAANITRDIVIYGESLGGPFAAFVAKNRAARCVIIDSSFPSLTAVGNANYFPLGYFAPWAMQTSAWLNESRAPVLVMHGKRDNVIPFSLGVALYESLRLPKQMLVSETADHCEIESAEPQKYYDAIVNFIANAHAPYKIS